MLYINRPLVLSISSKYGIFNIVTAVNAIKLLLLLLEEVDAVFILNYFNYNLLLSLLPYI